MPNMPHWGGGPPPFFPAIGAAVFFLLFLLALAAFLFMARRGGGRPPWARSAPEPPETDAKRTLADRFARGDLTVEEFMERASVLNWTPGTDTTDGDGKNGRNGKR
ncbi:hypothetical protein CDO52_08480 [Nocardiopsis gilva YIM 90087]|uniref:SHOCT domain-containing protein n=2 Tax=Nocardiopsis gilva TaxID=280236 RepID=A0A223SDD0_9ACTN|nr:hypothetical protein CDO52_08480 [Nocardiopsis gilva YIM 90087]